MRDKKRRWLYSLFSLILCLSMLVGTTLAWFTDAVRVTGNSVEAGELKIDFKKYASGKGYESIRNLSSDKSIFDDGDKLCWEPGMTQIIYLAVENQEGSIPAKYQILMDVNGIDTEDDTFEYAIYDGVKFEEADENKSEIQKAIEATEGLDVVAKWDALKAIEGVQKGTLESETYTAAPGGLLEAGIDADYFALAVHMSEEAGNEYQNKNIDIHVKVQAAQIDAEEPNLGSNVIKNEDFEKDTSLNSMNIAKYSNIVQRAQETDGNWYLELESINEKQLHVNAEGITSESDYVVYDFDFKVMGDKTQIDVRIIAPQNITDGKELMIAQLTKGDTFKYANQTEKLELNRWYNFAFAVDYYAGTVDYYFDGEWTASEALNPRFSADNKISILRFHRKSNLTVPIKFGLDNIRVYDSKTPMEDVGAVSKVIKLTDNTIFADDSGYKDDLEGYVAVHKRSGVVYVNGTKSMLSTLPAASVARSNETLINTAELAKILGWELPEGTDATMDVEKFFTELYSKQVVTDAKVVNSGMVIAGDTAYTLPTDEEALQDLNDYLFYLRMTDTDLLALYNQSAQKGTHPRIHATASDFEKIRTMYNNGSNLYITKWASDVISRADSLAEQDVVFYELRDGVRLLYVSRDVLERMYAFGMAYQLTQDKKYAERAYKELEAVSNFPDWHPSHTLDVAEMAAAVAVGYDWMYDAFTDEQRKVIEEGIYNNAFYDAVNMFQDGVGPFKNIVKDESNWNTVITGGLTMAALATMDVYPEIASSVLEDCVRASENYLANFAPYGAWYEGPNYWDYTVQYMTKAFDSLETVLGTDLRLGTAEGISTAARYMVNLQGDGGLFTYGDGGNTTIYTPEMIWMSNAYNDPDITKVIFSKTGGAMSNGEHMALALLWYDTSIVPGEVNLPLDAIYESDGTVSLHDSFATGETTFVGYHAGDNRASHGHLDAGSFVFDSAGVRWVVELGQDNYNQPGYWDDEDHGARWNIFRLRAEAHSTLVINSTADQDQEVNSFSTVNLESKERGAIIRSDLTEAYSVNASKVNRGLQLTDNRRSLVIRDEITLKKENSEVYWFMLSDADIEIEGNTATLTKNNKKLKMEYIATDAEGNTVEATEFTYAVAAPLHEETTFVNAETAKRIAIKFNASGDLNITVKLTPDTVYNPTAVGEYNKSIAEWSIPDGELLVAPKLDSLKVAGEDVTVEGLTNIYYYQAGALSEVPDIEATSLTATVEIQKGATLEDITRIVLTDMNDPSNQSCYSLIFKSVVAPMEFEGKDSIQVIGAVASEEPQANVGNVAVNVFDGDLSKKWASNVIGCYVTVDLKTVQSIDGVAVNFQGTPAGRLYNFTISVSDDGIEFEDVWTGDAKLGTTASYGDYELVDIGSTVQGRYVRITSNGNNQGSAWTSIGEIVVYRNSTN
ncbi:MAG: discoidin domain-containing protein [Lachnospiraceae bacterium]|nr:discoidin domain-containing protein [Lachnospiraceae bacterium]